MKQHGISKLDLKRQNRMQVLKILKQNGPTSRIDIANELGLTRAAVTIITNEMIEQGIIVELGEYKHVAEKAPRGRKKILIDINYHYKFVIGVAIEEDVISVGLSTLSGEVLDKRNMNVDSETSTEDMCKYIEASVHEILSDNCLDKTAVLGIGIGIYPDMYKRLELEVNNGRPDYSKFDDMVAQCTELPVVFDNSVKGSAWASIDFDRDKDPGYNELGFLQLGNNYNYVGVNFNESIITYENRTEFIERIIVDPFADEVCTVCGRRGCVENEITQDAIMDKIRKAYSKDKTPYLYQATKGDVKKLNKQIISAAYLNGDKDVVKIVDKSLVLFASLINNLFLSSNPHKIVLHNFDFNEGTDFDFIKAGVARVAGEEIANCLEISHIDRKHRFLSGCALAVRDLFFDKGGFDV